jgi:hypothetical protein
MKNKTSKPFEIVYITAIVTPTVDDEDVLTLLALDDYSEFLHPPVGTHTKISENELVGILVQFFNGINSTYDRNIHAQFTNYYIDLPEELHPLLLGLNTKDDKLFYEPKTVSKKFNPIIKKLTSFRS